jgi:hypothetical protein
VGWKIVRRRNNGYKFLVYDAVMGRVHFRMNLKKEEEVFCMEQQGENYLV